MAAHHQNVFVGVSLQNKGLQTRDYRAIVDRARAEFRFRKLMFLIADQIELINLRVFRKGREQKLLEVVGRQASTIETTIRSACDGDELKSGHIKTCRWIDILDAGYWASFFQVHRLFTNSPVLRLDVSNAIDEYAQRRDKSLSSAERLYLCSYVLHEIPTLLYGIRVNGKHYNSMVYPAPRNASIDRICTNLIDEKYSMTLFEPPFCTIVRYEIPLQ